MPHQGRPSENYQAFARGLVRELRKIEDLISELEHHPRLEHYDDIRMKLRNLNREVFAIRQILEM